MQEILERVWENLGGRIGGPLTLRIFLQPSMAAFFAIRDGLRDARTGRPAYFWAIAGDAEHRRELLQQGWKTVGKIFVIALVLDVVYQFKVFGRLYPVEALLVAALLALVPYLVLRGPVNRIARLFRRP